MAEMMIATAKNPSPLPSKVAGVDEVGRGCLFGPVVAAAVILLPGYEATLATLGVTDSKRLSPSRRETLVSPIQQYAWSYAIALATVREIDRLNILQASLLAMRRAVHRLTVYPDLCLVDGNQLIPELAIPQQTIVKGDQSEIAIAAASILAKVWRDRLMIRLDHRYPGYDLAANKGYGSQRHREGISQLGLTAQHRRSFRSGQQLVLPLSQSSTAPFP
jgi:ribonuclease HII